MKSFINSIIPDNNSSVINNDISSVINNDNSSIMNDNIVAAIDDNIVMDKSIINNDNSSIINNDNIVTAIDDNIVMDNSIINNDNIIDAIDNNIVMDDILKYIDKNNNNINNNINQKNITFILYNNLFIKYVDNIKEYFKNKNVQIIDLTEHIIKYLNNEYKLLFRLNVDYSTNNSFNFIYDFINIFITKTMKNYSTLYYMFNIDEFYIIPYIKNYKRIYIYGNSYLYYYISDYYFINNARHIFNYYDVEIDTKFEKYDKKELLNYLLVQKLPTNSNYPNESIGRAIVAINTSPNDKIVKNFYKYMFAKINGIKSIYEPDNKKYIVIDVDSKNWMNNCYNLMISKK